VLKNGDVRLARDGDKSLITWKCNFLSQHLLAVGGDLAWYLHPGSEIYTIYVFYIYICPELGRRCLWTDMRLSYLLYLVLGIST